MKDQLSQSLECLDMWDLRLALLSSRMVHSESEAQLEEEIVNLKFKIYERLSETSILAN